MQSCGLLSRSDPFEAIEQKNSVLRPVNSSHGAFPILPSPRRRPPFCPRVCHRACCPSSRREVVARYPHSTDSFTEGFFYLNGIFYEGTGFTGHSALLAIDPQTGRATQHHDLPPQYLGEGIVDWGPNILEWTWKSHVGFVIDRFGMQVVRQFTYTGEGWGMTRTARELITAKS
jgi:glutamine cyclotransferase